MAAADEDESVGALAQGGPQPGQVGGDRAGQQFHLAAAGLQRPGQAGAQRSEVDAVRVGEQLLQGEPVRVGAEALPVGAEAQHHVQAPFGAVVAGEQAGELLRVAAVHRGVRCAHGLAQGLLDHQVVHGRRVGAVHARGGEDEPGEDLGLGHAAGFEGHGGGV